MKWDMYFVASAYMQVQKTTSSKLQLLLAMYFSLSRSHHAFF